jgi:aryl-alcohol dehydrogenase-like predicted oxidoreductase
MTFGTARWGTGDAASRAVFDAYVDAGGNFVDTADVYAGGRGEELLGGFIAERGLRDQLVVATKAGFAAGRGPHAGGLGAKHLHAASTARSAGCAPTTWTCTGCTCGDGVTPAEELPETMAALVRSGKVRYWGLSNTPAWYVAKVATLAAARGTPGPIALQYFYSLVNRDVEDEHVPLAADAGMGLVPWSPLAYGLLTGKYDRAQVESAAPRAGGVPNDAAADAPRPEDDKRLDGANPFGDSLFTERNWRIVDAVRRVAAEAGESPARVALAWVLDRPGVTSTLMGREPRGAGVGQRRGARRDAVGRAPRRARHGERGATARMLYGLFTPRVRSQVVFGGSEVTGWRE